MRLTKTDKEAFVKAVMLDVPKIDYEEQLRKAITAKWEAMLPADLGEWRRKYPDRFKSEYIYNAKVIGPVHPSEHRDIMGSPDILALYNSVKEQAGTREELREKLYIVIRSCVTLEQAQERLPEFAKYLPADRDGTGVSNLPAVAGVVAD